MRRREFISLIASAAAWPVLARAQQSGRIPVVGVLWDASAEKEQSNPFYHSLHDDFTRFGYISDKTVKYEERYASEKQELLEQLASNLVSLGPDVLIAPSSAAALALKKATSQIPIVFQGASDPVGAGLVASIPRPGGNVTGIAASSPEVHFKRIAILKEIIPRLSRLALLADLDLPDHAALEIQYISAAAKGNAVRLEVFAARDRNSIDEVFPKIVQSGCDAVVIAGQGTFYLLRDELSGAALSNRVPTMAPSGVFVSSGLLISYGTIIRDRYRETVAYAVRILRGESLSICRCNFLRSSN
jgi:putative ABC transport system substrate-binding protein